jgi:hypothetical protein
MSIPVGTEPRTGAAKTHQSGRQVALRHAITFSVRLPFGPS